MIKNLTIFAKSITWFILFNLILSPVYAQESKKLIVIDEAIRDYSLLSKCMNQEAEIYILPQTNNQLESLTEEIARHKDLDAMFLFICGKDGMIMFNGAPVDFDNITKYSQLLEQWNASFTENADLLIYTCNLANTNNGKGLIRRLSAYTGLDVAASINDTGNPEQIDGDWKLEFIKGEIESECCLNPQNIKNYKGTFKRTE
jgi:Domain of unknown function (DUF4347)